jgi:hypothetical protein
MMQKDTPSKYARRSGIVDASKCPNFSECATVAY